MKPERTKEEILKSKLGDSYRLMSFIDFDRLLEAMEEYRQSSPVEKWVKVSERLPERGGEFLVLVDRRVLQCFWFDGWFYKAVDQRLNPTHWQPLPELPPIEEPKEK